MSNTDGPLRSFFNRVKTLEIEKRERAEDIKEVLIEAKEAGFNPAAIRAAVKDDLLNQKQRDARALMAEVIEKYKAALGMLADTPLGKAALASSPSIKRALDKFGTPVELTDEERAKGQTAAFIDKDGARTSFGLSFAKT